MGEFDLIYQQLAPRAGQAADVILGIGDDAALMQPAVGQRLVAAMDTLVSGRHFPADQPAEDIGWKTLAVNLSDLAAMGARPRWALLSLTLSEGEARPEWLAAFMRGWQALAQQHELVLVGGDTTRGPTLTLSVTLLGLLPADQALTRGGAAAGEDIWVSGHIGDAGLALWQWQRGLALMPSLAQRWHRPIPRLALGQALHGLATAALDVSDGLLADLGHLLDASGVGAELVLDDMPLQPEVQYWADQQGWFRPLVAGDDYELLFTAPVVHRAALQQLSQQLACPLTRIGQLASQRGIRIRHGGQYLPLPEQMGFDHFAASDTMTSP